MLEDIEDSYQRIGIMDNVLGTDLIVTADTGFANEENMQYCHDNDINAYISDNQFRSRDPRFKEHLKQPSHQRAKKHIAIFPTRGFQYDPIATKMPMSGRQFVTG